MLFTLFWEIGVFLGLDLNLPEWEPKGSPCLCLPALGLQIHASMLAMGVLGIHVRFLCEYGCFSKRDTKVYLDARRGEPVQCLGHSAERRI